MQKRRRVDLILIRKPASVSGDWLQQSFIYSINLKMLCRYFKNYLKFNILIVFRYGILKGDGYRQTAIAEQTIKKNSVLAVLHRADQPNHRHVLLP